MARPQMVLVGASPRLLERELGEQIERFPLVGRFNDYHIDGFERHVGRRTTHWITGLSRQALVRGRSTRGISVLCAYPAQVYRKRPSRVERSLLVWKRLGINPLVCAEMRREEVEEIERLTEVPYCSTGLLGIAYFAFLRGYDVSLAGFDFFTSTRQHYYTERQLESVRAHDFAREKRVVTAWARQGLVRVLDELPD